jgi:hypothetical protein
MRKENAEEESTYAYQQAKTSYTEIFMSVFCLAKIHHRKEVNYVTILRNATMVN